ncbi:hypothetical protein VP1G_10865 [Cytospora mali]|uniref:Uncharacterized protein n=1 Tax=Cytospora mali TaxID=578113 RepID=A0A194UY25_CYTMA|nr:hypothetical protein VP1G_10865 [Valsa mali var. pyri (nom. inval.)]
MACKGQGRVVVAVHRGDSPDDVPLAGSIVIYELLVAFDVNEVTLVTMWVAQNEWRESSWISNN